MKVLICGADDLREEIFPAFDRVIRNMSFQPHHFDDLIPGVDNYNDWIKNSVQYVNDADMIVFVLKARSGMITWQHEYIKAINEGKPFIILVAKKLLEKYFDDYKTDQIKDVESHLFFGAFKTLDILLSQYRSPFTFNDIKDFEETLLKAVQNEIEKALKVFQVHNKRRSLIQSLGNENYASFLRSDIGRSEIEFLRSVLLDVFEHKELRKRVLKFFTIKKSLADDDIIQLLEDTEQGIVRATTDQLADLLSPENNKIKLVEFLISTAEETTDTGILRRAIATIFKIDITLAVKHLSSLFPAYDIGTPKRILKWLLDNPDKIKHHLLTEDFCNDLERLIKLSESYSTKPETLNEMAVELRDLIENAKTKSSS